MRSAGTRTASLDRRQAAVASPPPALGHITAADFLFLHEVLQQAPKQARISTNAAAPMDAERRDALAELRSAPPHKGEVVLNSMRLPAADTKIGMDGVQKFYKPIPRHGISSASGKDPLSFVTP